LALLRSAARRPEAIEEPPGIVEAQPDGTVTALTTPAQRWLDEGGLPLVTAVNMLAAAVRARRDWVGAASRVVVSDGCVLSLHGASMTASDNAIAVIVELARPAEVRAMLVDAYGLTRRQRDVLGHLLHGRSIAELARLLAISEHTANDHRKAIYQRMGVSSRSQLAALLQSEQYDPRVWQDIPPSPYGGFLTAST
jgi:DNA-binding CsgD family transcriptional regulator